MTLTFRQSARKKLKGAEETLLELANSSEDNLKRIILFVHLIFISIWVACLYIGNQYFMPIILKQQGTKIALPQARGLGLACITQTKL